MSTDYTRASASEKMIETWYRYAVEGHFRYVFVGHGVDASSAVYVGFGDTWLEARAEAHRTPEQAAGPSRQQAHGRAIMWSARGEEVEGTEYENEIELWDACESYSVVADGVAR